MDRTTALNNAQRYAQVVAKELKPSFIYLYGSHAKGTAGTDSDIDVAVVFDGFSGDWLETSSYLWRLRRDISDDIEPVLLDSTYDPSGFIADIFKVGKILYSDIKANA